MVIERAHNGHSQKHLKALSRGAEWISHALDMVLAAERNVPGTPFAGIDDDVSPAVKVRYAASVK